jgi:hypothetical protein
MGHDIHLCVIFNQSQRNPTIGKLRRGTDTCWRRPSGDRDGQGDFDAPRAEHQQDF